LVQQAISAFERRPRSHHDEQQHHALSDAAYALDVLEHVPATDESQFMDAVLLSLEAHGVLILGMPSLESQSMRPRSASADTS